MKFSMLGNSETAPDAEFKVQIEDDEHPTLWSLCKSNENWLFSRLANLYEDQLYSIDDITEGKKLLFQSLSTSKNRQQKELLYKLIAIFTYALRHNMPLSAQKAH